MSIPASNPQTFGWIKSALNQSMLQALESLSEVQSNADSAPLESVSRNLHQIQGSLQMVELEAASLLAGELEILTAQLTDSGVNQDSSASVETIRRGLENLEHYLAGIENQTPQSPFVLVEEINTIREITSREKISLYDLFNPPLDLNSVIFSEKALQFPDDKRKNVLFHLRKRFRHALLSWLNQEDEEESLATMVEMAGHLQHVSGLEVLKQLWWVAAGFVESIKQGNIGVETDVKAQFAKLDYEISRMSDDNRSAIASSPPDELLRQMLFHIGSCSDQVADNDSETRANQIRKLLGLDMWFAFGPEYEQQLEYENLSHEILELAASFDAEKLRVIENSVDLYFSTEMDAIQTQDYHDQFEFLKDTAKDREIGVLSRFIGVLCESAQKVNPDIESVAKTGADIKIATSLLLLKDALKNPSVVSSDWEQSILARTDELSRLIDPDDTEDKDIFVSKQQSASELAQARKALAGQIKSHIAQLEQEFTRIGNAANESEILHLVQGKIDDVGRWFGFIEAEEEALLSKTTSVKLSKIQGAGTPMGESENESIAFAIATLGVCAEQMEVHGENPESSSVIARALNMLDGLSILDQPNVIQDDEVNKIDQPGDGEIEDIESIDYKLDSDKLDLVDSDLNLDLEQAVEEYSLSQLESLDRQLDQLDEMRKRIKSGDDNEIECIRLSLMFSAIEDNHDSHASPKTAKLASIGSQLCKSIVDGDLVVDAEVEDFIGLLSRQIRQLETPGENQLEVDIEDWTEKFRALVGFDPTEGGWSRYREHRRHG